MSDSKLRMFAGRIGTDGKHKTMSGTEFELESNVTAVHMAVSSDSKYAYIMSTSTKKNGSMGTFVVHKILLSKREKVM